MIKNLPDVDYLLIVNCIDWLDWPFFEFECCNSIHIFHGDDDARFFLFVFILKVMFIIAMMFIFIINNCNTIIANKNYEDY